MRRLALILVLALLPTAALAETLTVQQKQQVTSIEQVTSQLRQLTPLRPVKVVVDSDPAFDKVIRAEQQAVSPETEIQTSQREGVLLGLLKKSDNLRHIILSDTPAHVYGLYDRTTKTLYVRNHDNYAFSIESHVLAHEYNHALEDQHFDLTRLLPDQTPLAYRNTDMVAAHHALAEGDSVNVEHLFVYKTYTRAELLGMEQFESQQLGPKLPTSVERQLAFPYTYGYDFALTLYHHGGMAAVNGAYTRLPASTYEIMHPSAYLEHWKPVDVALHSVTGFTDWKQVDDDVWGAFGYNLLLRQFVSGKRADKVTSAYRGDRYVFLENGTQNAMLFKSVWNDNASARAARDALVSALKARYKKAQVTRLGVYDVTFKGGAAAFKVLGAGLTMAYAPTVAIARQLATAPVS